MRPIRAKDLAIALAVFAALTTAYTFPLALAPGEANRLDTPDALLNAWIVSWDLYQLARDPVHLFDANIFFPERATLAYSENLVSGALVAAPVRLLTGNPIALYNAALFGAFVLTGVGTFVLALDVTGDRLAALLAGAVFAFAPYRFAHIPHLQLLLAFGIPLSLFWTRRLISGRAHGWAVAGFAATAVATFGSSVYYAVFVLTAAPIVAAAELRHLPASGRPRALGRFAAASAAAFAATLPLALPYLGKLEAGSVRSLAAAAGFSAGLGEYASSFSHVHGFLPKAPEPLFPGFAALGLAAAALGGFAARGSRKWCWAAVGAAGAAISAGPALGLFSLLYHVAAPYRAIRVPSRAGVLVLLAVALLAAAAFARIRSRGIRAALVLAALAECFAAPLPLSREAPSYPPIYEAVEALAGPGALVELPMPPPERFQDNAIYVYRSIRHRRDLVNGYSGFVPPAYRRWHRRIMREDLVPALRAARNDGVRFVLAHEGRLGPRMVRQLRQGVEDGALVILAEAATDRLYAIAESATAR